MPPWNHPDYGGWAAARRGVPQHERLCCALQRVPLKKEADTDRGSWAGCEAPAHPRSARKRHSFVRVAPSLQAVVVPRLKASELGWRLEGEPWAAGAVCAVMQHTQSLATAESHVTCQPGAPFCPAAPPLPADICWLCPAGPGFVCLPISFATYLQGQAPGPSRRWPCHEVSLPPPSACP